MEGKIVSRKTIEEKNAHKKFRPGKMYIQYQKIFTRGRSSSSDEKTKVKYLLGNVHYIINITTKSTRMRLPLLAYKLVTIDVFFDFE